MRAITVSSLFANLETLALEAAPRSGQALLGARWSFGFPTKERAGTFTEYSFPLGTRNFPDLLASRTGLCIREHGPAESECVYRHLSTGKAAILVIDSFYLPYRPAYRRVHSHRTVIVRPAPRPGEAWIEDPWPPVFRGTIQTKILEAARHSEVPLDHRREPIFAGRPIDGEWWSLELLSIPIMDAPAWAGRMLADLCAEAESAFVDSQAEYGLVSWIGFRSWLEAVLSRAAGTHPCPESFRLANLILRAELSSRVYFCAFLKAAGGWIGDPALRPIADGYYTDLRHMEIVRDMMTKSLTCFRPQYSRYILDHLREAIDADRRLSARLGGYVEKLMPPRAVEFLHET